jgi:hypothetical protein
MPELSRDDHIEIARAGTHPDWLDEKRRQVEVTMCFVAPLCPCDWTWDEDEMGGRWLLARRERECELHGEQGLF